MVLDWWGGNYFLRRHSLICEVLKTLWDLLECDFHWITLTCLHTTESKSVHSFSVAFLWFACSIWKSERDHLFSIGSFTLQMLIIARASLHEAKNKNLPLGLPCGWEGPKHPNKIHDLWGYICRKLDRVKIWILALQYALWMFKVIASFLCHKPSPSPWVLFLLLITLFMCFITPCWSSISSRISPFAPQILTLPPNNFFPCHYNSIVPHNLS